MNGLFVAIASLMLSSLPTSQPLVVVEAKQIESAVAQQILRTEKIAVQASCGDQQLSFTSAEKKLITCDISTAEISTSFSADVTLHEKEGTVHVEVIILPVAEK